MLTITAVGEILIDLTQTGADENGVGQFAANPGGAPANLAVAAAKLGAKAAFIGCVGDDVFGKTLAATLEANGVDASGLQVTKETSTTIAVVSVRADGERSFSFLRKPGADTRLCPEKALGKVREAGILHFGSVSLTDPDSRAAVVSLVEEGRKNGALVTYDPNYRAPLWDSEEEAVREMRAVLPLCDIVKLSDEETELLTGEKEPGRAAQALHALGVRLAVITLGPDGALWSFDGKQGREPGFPVTVADTNGAGDTFFGAFLSRVALRGGLGGLTEEELSSYVRFSNCAASLTAGRSGALPAMPCLSAVEEKLA